MIRQNRENRLNKKNDCNLRYNRLIFIVVWGGIKPPDRTSFAKTNYLKCKVIKALPVNCLIFYINSLVARMYVPVEALKLIPPVSSYQGYLTINRLPLYDLCTSIFTTSRSKMGLICISKKCVLLPVIVLSLSKSVLK